MGFFDLFSGKDDTPPAPEKRVVPSWAENITNPIESWITTQVFIDKKDKSKRIYYAAAHMRDDTWRIVKYSYSATDQNSSYSSDVIGSKNGAGEAIPRIAEIEKLLLEEGYTPVDVLRGNYREAANQNGAYFDDKGNYVPVTQDAPIIEKDALIDRKGIQALYSKAAGKSAEPVIRTWDDFYREIVRNSSQEGFVLSEQDKQNPNFPKIMAHISDTLTVMHALEGAMTAGTNIQQLKKAARSFSGTAFNELAMKISWGNGEYDEDGGTPKIVYDYEAARLTTLMRMGARLYQKLTTSLSVDADGLQLLESISNNLSAFAEERLYCSPEQAKQLANVIMQGPDPYADKPLPLEIFYKQYQDQVSAPAPKKNKPKPPAAG
ncbi:MAG: hypothetical protein K8R48_04435 [Alphaproteobacteria bacterium]|nr:hypothetical protein [Alphaproteobacteria bacterium]